MWYCISQLEPFFNILKLPKIWKYITFWKAVVTFDNCHLFGTFISQMCVNILHTLAHLHLTIVIEHGYNYPHFAEEETESQMTLAVWRAGRKRRNWGGCRLWKSRLGKRWCMCFHSPLPLIDLIMISAVGIGPHILLHPVGQDHFGRWTCQMKCSYLPDSRWSSGLLLIF